MPISLRTHCGVLGLTSVSSQLISLVASSPWAGKDTPRPAAWLILEQWAAWKDHLSFSPGGPFLKQRAVVSQPQGLVLVTLG